MNINHLLGRVSAGRDLSLDEMAGAVDGIMQGRWTEAEIALLLTALKAKGETVDELAGAARAMRRHMTPIRSRHEVIVDTCGTGGTASGTFNISTTAALVTAAAGVPVAKHGNRRVTSRSGSADVLRELGVNIEAPVACVERCLDELGICFCFAPLLHGAMKHVAPVRRKLGVSTIFNMLGPLANPAGAPFQVLGVGHAAWQPLIAGALARLGTRRALVVRGDDGLGEITLATTTQVSDVRGAAVRRFAWTPADFALPVTALDELQVADASASAAVVRRVLAGQPGPARNIVVINAAAAILVTGRAAGPVEAAVLAAGAIDSGAARDLLARLVEMTNA